MSNFLSKITEKLAVTQYNKFDLSCDNVTTNDFFKLKPVYTRELMPKQSINIRLSQFTRTMPMAKPFFGSCKFVNRAFFVPYRTVMKGFNEFITDTKIDEVIPQVPRTTISHLAYSLNQHAYNATSLQAADFVYVNSDGSKVNRAFNREGKILFDILNNLGYKINFDATDETIVSVLPILAYEKVMRDWYSNKQYLNTNYSPYSLVNFTYTELQPILTRCLYAQFEKDYFTSAWDNPVSPTNSNISAIQISDSTVDNSGYNAKIDVNSSLNNTPVVQGYDGDSLQSLSPYRFSQYIDTALHKVTDYVKRHQLAGSLAMDRFFARYGIHMSDAVLSRSTYIGKFEQVVNIADVMNTTAPQNSSGPALGEYAAKAISNGNGNFSYKSDEFGQLIIVSVLLPRTSYVQGRDRQLFHLDKFSFFTPEFDMLGVQAIRMDELYAQFTNKDSDDTRKDGYSPNGVFGYTSRYAEYKNAQDRLTGDFALSVNNASSDNNRWNLMRIVNQQHAINGHNLNFCTAGNNNIMQYDRIFADSNTDFDHFISIFHFDVTSTMPCAKMYDDYDWSECDAKNQTINLGGTQLD